ncbi:MAG: hypothetical protein ACREQR_03165 [Candidatus Binataceae bacterium]
MLLAEVFPVNPLRLQPSTGGAITVFAPSETAKNEGAAHFGGRHGIGTLRGAFRVVFFFAFWCFCGLPICSS